MQDLSPDAIDHAEIMRLIRAGSAFRAAPPLPQAAPGFSAAPLAVALPDAPPAAPRAPEPIPEDVFRPAPPPPEIDLALIRAEARALGRAEAEAGLSEVRAEAHAAGRAEALAEAAQDLATARRALLSAAAALTDATEAATATVFAAVEAAILRLASERAGIAIDANPAPFRARIEALASRIAGAGAAAEIRLNPDDLAVLGPEAGGFTADARLSRGDVVMRAGDVVIEDILAGPRP
jgi:flagellar assembly protein FliH